MKKPLRKAGLAAHSSMSTPSSSSHVEQAQASSSILQYIRNPVHKNKRRASDASSHGDDKAKRRRSDPTNNDSDDDVIVVDGPITGGQENVVAKPQGQQQQKNRKKELSSENKLDPIDVVNCFRLDPKALGYAA